MILISGTILKMEMAIVSCHHIMAQIIEICDLKYNLKNSDGTVKIMFSV
jgi:hypothetical protein